MDERLSVFQQNRLDFEEKAVEPYENIFTSDSSSYKTLQEYVENNGGFTYLYNHDFNFQKIISSTKSQVDYFNTLLLFNLDDIELDLHKTFSDPSVMVGEVITSRAKANLLINYFITKVYISKQQAYLMLNDEINVIQTALKSGEINSNWLQKNSIPYFYYGELGESAEYLEIPWESATAFVNPLLSSKLQKVTDTLVGVSSESSPAPNMFPPLKGISPDLANQLIKHKCYIPSIRKNVQGNLATFNLPFILEWYPNGNTPGGEANVIANCYDGENFVSSTYYYTESANIMTNIFGILYPNGFINKVVDADSTTLYDSADQEPDIQLSSFKINSNYPLKINSTTVSISPIDLNSPDNLDSQIYGKVGLSGQYWPVYLVYYNSYNDLYVSLHTLGVDPAGTILSTLLAPVDSSSKSFISKIYNHYQYYTVETNNIVYLRVQENGITYNFGLRIKNYSLPIDCESYTCIQHSILNLVCLPDSGCKVDPSVPTKIVWEDGTYANFTQMSNQPIPTMFLDFGNKNQ